MLQLLVTDKSKMGDFVTHVTDVWSIYSKYNAYRLLNVYCEIFKFIWRRTHKLASASPPYEQVPNISQYTFNNLFIIYLLH